MMVKKCRICKIHAGQDAKKSLKCRTILQNQGHGWQVCVGVEVISFLQCGTCSTQTSKFNLSSLPTITAAADNGPKASSCKEVMITI